MGDAMGDDTRLAASRAGENEQWTVDVCSSFPLLGI